MSHFPSLLLHDLDLRFSSPRLHKLVVDHLTLEPLLELIVGQLDSQEQVRFYLITEYGTLIQLVFDCRDKVVKDVKVTSYIKDMVVFKIMKIKATENLQICMLIEHDCLCLVMFYDEGVEEKHPTIMNEENQNLA